jgi:haloalkane dehalogenase
MKNSNIEIYRKFQKKYMEIGGNRIHYVDVGEGPVVVLLHGSPISSFSFRHQIAALKDRFRVIAPDLLGYGRSSAPEKGAGFILQANVLRSFLDSLNLSSIRLLVHDWGGPIGLGCAAMKPEQISQLVLVNTTFLPDFHPPPYWRLFIAPLLGDFLLVRINFFCHFLPFLLNAARNPIVRAVYAQPFKKISTRRTVLALERLTGFRPLMESVVKQPSMFQVPTLILWGKPDPYFRATELARLRSFFKNVTVKEIPGAGHFPQEDAPEDVTNALLKFLK